MKEYEGLDKEVEHVMQMCLVEVSSLDLRYIEKAAPQLSEEFPDGSKIFFLGEHVYSMAEQVSAMTQTSLSVILAVLLHLMLDMSKFPPSPHVPVSQQPFSCICHLLHATPTSQHSPPTSVHLPPSHLHTFLAHNIHVLQHPLLPCWCSTLLHLLFTPLVLL